MASLLIGVPILRFSLGSMVYVLPKSPRQGDQARRVFDGPLHELVDELGLRAGDAPAAHGRRAARRRARLRARGAPSSRT